MSASFQPQALRAWQAPEFWQAITTVDAHTEGEPLRIISGGYPSLAGKTILEKRADARDTWDHLRTTLMWEPRGHADMYGCIVTPPVRADSDFGVLFLHNEGYSTMCGHAIIAVTRVSLETGMLPMTAPETVVRIDTPAGQVTAFARVNGDKVQSVAFHNVPSYVVELDAQVDVQGLGKIRYDLGFGGAYYAYVKAEDAGVKLDAGGFRELISKGMAIKNAVMAQREITHPTEPDLNFLYGTIFTGPPHKAGHHSRNVCIFAEGEVDRSPTGTGVSGRIAIHHARGEISIGEKIIIESILGTWFTGSCAKTTTFGPHPAVIPEVEGRAYITGTHRFLIDPDDPLKYGFILR